MNLATVHDVVMQQHPLTKLQQHSQDQPCTVSAFKLPTEDNCLFREWHPMREWHPRVSVLL